MTDRTAAMKNAKRTINGEKYERVRAVIAQIRDHGRDDELKATIIARRAGVHRSFVSSHFAAEVAHARTDIQSRFIAGLNGQTALSAASLRVEMETAKQQAREAQQEIRALKARLARTLGEEVAATHPEHGAASATVKELRSEVERLLAAQADLRRQLRETEEELEAARRLNRTLMRERNTTAGEAIT
jgi:chromosome segregation ATPase